MKTLLSLIALFAIGFLVWLIADESAGPAPLAWAPTTLAERVAAASEACVTAWGALPGYAPISPRGGSLLEGDDEIYGCTGLSERAGAMFAVVRYAGGDRTRPESYRIDALCGSEGSMLLEAGGRTPEMCAASPL